MEGLHFDITGDNKSLVNSLREAQQAMGNTIGLIEQGGRQVNSEMDKMGQGIENTFKRIAQAAAGVFAVSQAKQMVSQIIDVRKEFQSLELSFQTLMGSASAGKKMFQDITQFATSTPMLEKDLAKGAQTLLGFNIEAEKVMPILKQIGDISMADSQKFESLTLAFAQASSTGKLMGQDLLQMINAGFNPLVEMSRTTGRSLEDLKDAMSKGEISVDMLQNAFKTATDEGGKFHGMLNGMAQGMQGAFSNLEGAIQKFYNDAGQKIEKPLVEGANAATEAVNGLAENIDAITEAAQAAAVAFGAYKATTMLLAAAEAARTGITATAQEAELAQLHEVIAMKAAEVGAEGEVTIAKNAAVSARTREIQAAREEMKAVLANLEAKAQEARANLVNAQSERAMAQARLSSAEQGIIMRERDLAVAVATGDARKIEIAETNLNVAALERNQAAKAAKIATDRVEAAQLAATNTAKVAETAATTADTIATTSDTTATGFLAKAKLALSAAIDKVTASLARNPMTLAAVAVAALAAVLWKAYDAYTAHIKQQEDLRKQIEKTTNAGVTLRQTLKDLGDNAFKRLNEKTAETVSKYKTLQAKWKECNGDARLQKRFINDNKSAFHDLGYEVNSVTTAETFLVKNTSSVVAALQARAKATAYQELATEAYKQKILKEGEIKGSTSKYRKATSNTHVGELNDYERDALTEAVNSGKLKRTRDLTSQATLTKEAQDFLNDLNRKRLLDRRTKALSDLDKNTSATIDAYTTEAAKAAKEAEAAQKKAGVKTYEETDKEKKAREKQEREAKKDAATAEKRKDLREKLHNELVQMQLDNDNEEIAVMKEGVAKKVEEREQEFRKEMEQLRKQAQEWSDENKKAEVKGTTSQVQVWSAEGKEETVKGLTGDQAAAITRRKALLGQSREKDTADIFKDYDPSADRKEKEAKLTRDIAALEKSIKEMQESGSQEAVENMKKRLQYAQAMLKVSQSQSQVEWLKGSKDIYSRHEGNLMELENQRAMIDPSDTYAIFQNDRQVEEENTRFADEAVKLQSGVEQLWQYFGTLSTQALEQLQSQLKDAVEHGVNGKHISEELKRELEDKLNDIKVQLETGGPTGGLFGDGKTFGSGGMMGGSWMGQIGQNLKKASDAQAKAQADNAKWKADKQALAEAQAKQSDLSDQYKAAKKAGDMQQAAQLQQQLQSAQAATQAAQGAAAASGAAAGASGAAAGGGAGGAAITEAIIKGVNQNVQSFGEAAQYLWDKDSDTYKGVQKFAESSQYAVQGFESLKNGDLIGTVLNVGKAISSLGESFGLWSNSNREEVESENEKLAASQSVLTEAINKLTDQMKKQSASEAYDTYQAAERNLKTQQQNALKTMQNNAGMYDGGHSLNYDYNENSWSRLANAQLIKQLYEQTGDASKYGVGKELKELEARGYSGKLLAMWARHNDGTTLQSVMNIDPADLYKLYDTDEGTAAINQIVQEMLNNQDDGNYNGMGNDWLNYISTYNQDAYDELKNQFYETVNGLSFESFQDNFLSMMMDLESEIDDFGDSFTEQLTKSIMNDQLKSKYNTELEKLYKDWGELMQNREKLTSKEFNAQATALQETEAKLSAQMIADRDAIAAATGYSENESQKATRSSIENITQDQADQLIGRITAMQIAVEASNATNTAASATSLNSYNVLMSMNNVMSLANANLSDILMQNVQSNSYLADIVKTQRSIYEELEGRIEKITNKIETI